MGYEIAINKAWEELAKLKPAKNLSVKFLADEYSIDVAARKVMSLSCNVPAKDFPAVLILHYLIRKLQGLPALTEEWLPFRELSGIEGYFSAFKKRSVEPIIRKYGKNPQGIFQVLDRITGKKVQGADEAIVLQSLEGVPVLIKLWRSDEEFGADANIFFDRSITEIFCIEDIVVLAGLVAASL
jgi:hypothetical protein